MVGTNFWICSFIKADTCEQNISELNAKFLNFFPRLDLTLRRTKTRTEILWVYFYWFDYSQKSETVFFLIGSYNFLPNESKKLELHNYIQWECNTQQEKLIPERVNRVLYLEICWHSREGKVISSVSHYFTLSNISNDNVIIIKWCEDWPRQETRDKRQHVDDNRGYSV